MVLGGLAGFGAAFLLGYLHALGSAFGFFQLWGALLFGGAVGEVILRATQRKRGVKMEALTAVAVTGGVIASALVWYARVAQLELGPGATFEEFIQTHIYYVVSMVIMVFSAVSRVRFF